jgi:hypothetical protein
MLSQKSSSSRNVARAKPDAARTPTWRRPPPSILRMRYTRSMKGLGPATIEPAGAPSPCNMMPGGAVEL